MTLNSIDYKQKVDGGKRYERTEFTLGEHYRVVKNVTIYEDGEVYKRFSVNMSFEDRHNNYIPEIYYEDGIFGDEKPEFRIQTAGYGAMDAETIKKIIAGYQEALEAVEILNKNFC